jgi:two-component system, NarL family, response regulator LiaR
MNDVIRIMIVDDHEIVREGLHTLLSEEPDIEVVGLAVNGAQAVEMAPSLQPDVILMDLVMPEMDGITATSAVRQAAPDSQVLILTSFAEDENVRLAIQAGAIGFVLKDVMKPDLLRAIRSASRGEPALDPEAQRALIRQSVGASSAPPSHASLTERELEVLRLLAQGQSNRQIGLALHLTEGTVKVYVSTILRKLDVEDRTQAALYAVKHGLVANT